MKFVNPFAVVNPNSANGSTARQWPQIEALLKEAIGPFTHAFTKSQGDATPLAREAAHSGCDLVISVGGDGTNNEVVNGLLADGAPRPGPMLAFVPRGTGGDLRKTLGIENTVEAAVRRIAEGSQKKIDAARMEITDHEGRTVTRHFVNITSFGIGGLVDQKVNNSTKALGGKASFFIGTVKAFAAYRNQRVRVSFDGAAAEEMTINNVAVANGKFFGGGMMIAPEAQIDDGFFDVVILGDLTLWEVITNGTKVYKGRHMPHSKIRALRAKTVRAEPVNPEDRVLLDVDGEAPGRLPATFEILPAALTVVA
ncbi:MAG: diacylglycerol kinase family lipid kinase [Deltaproteobacteria bacterium]|nr:diacylglycerol kinase family lipid kinase [Deltaproteobacteria bacterium]